jgi:hypothetical protein
MLNSSNIVLDVSHRGHACDCWLPFFLHTLYRGVFVMSPPEETSPYTSGSLLIAMTL